MRILGFSKRWPKLEQPEFTTFRFTRRDRDWEVGELAQIVVQFRRKGGGERLGVAEIISKEECWIFTTKKSWGAKTLTSKEAWEDGFKSCFDMAMWLVKAHGHQRLVDEHMNKLTLRWIT